MTANERREMFAAAALTFMRGDGIVSASIPSLAKATGRDAEWKKEMIAATAKAAFEIADAMLEESDKP